MKDREQQVVEAIDNLFCAINVMGGEGEIKAAVKIAMMRQHRTLKQSFMRVVLIPALQHFAEMHETGQYDLRNEASCKLAVELNKEVNKHHLPFI